MSEAVHDGALDPDAFIERLRQEGARRYHDHHHFHVAMHAGTLSREQLQAWVRNRYYYQTRIPIKDALILAKSEDPAFRRAWIRRIHDHDGDREGDGGLELWLRLAEGVGLDRGEVASCAGVLPGVRFACDAYVELVRERSLVEAVASSLTEFFAPESDEPPHRGVGAPLPVGQERGARVLPFARAARAPRLRGRDRVRGSARAHARVARARRRGADPQDRNFVAPARLRRRRARPNAERAAMIARDMRPRLSGKARLRFDRHSGQHMLVYPEKGLALNPTAFAVVELCTGEHSVAQIIDELAARFADAPRERIEDEVSALLEQLALRGLLQDAP